MKFGTRGIATFGFAFKKGDFPRDKSLELNGQPFQVDIKTTHDDGSAKYAVLTGEGDGELKVIEGQAYTHVPQPPSEKVTLNGRVLNWLNEDPWLSGHLVSESRYVFRDDIVVIQDVRTDGYLDLTFWNTTSKSLKVKASCRDWAEEWEQWPYTIYVKRFGSRKPVKRDMVYLRDSGALPYFDLAQKVSLGGIEERFKEIDLSPMAHNLCQPKMGNAGQQDKRHVGLCPMDDQAYLLTQDPRALEVMRAYSHGGCSIGWHGGRSRNGDWDWDYAHQPAFHYMLALLTGERAYHDLLVNQAEVCLADRGEKDLGLMVGQTRSFAWKLRTVCQAVYLTGKLEAELNRDLDNWRNKYFASAYEKMGPVRGVNDRKMSKDQNKGKTPPWQDSYLMMVLCWAERMGLSVSDILDWKLPYHVGMCRDHPGYAWTGAANYLLGTGSPRTGNMIDGGEPFVKSWADLWQGPRDNPETVTEDLTNGKPHRAGQYAAETMGMLCCVAERRPDPEIIETAKRWVQHIASSGGFSEAISKPKWMMARVWEDNREPNLEPKDKVDPFEAETIVEGYTIRLGEIDPLTKGAFVSETERLLEEVKNLPIMETVLVDHVSKSDVLAEFDNAKSSVESLPTQTIDGTVGVVKTDAESIADTARTNIGNLAILTESPPPPPGDIIVPIYTKLFPLVPMDGVHPLDRGQGFNDGTCTFDPVAELFVAQNTGQTKEWFRMPHSLAPLGGQGTYMVDVFVVRWKEWDWINKRIDENELQPPHWFDFQVGGDGSWHPNIEGNIQDQGLPRHREIYCQWNNMAVCWDNQGVRFYLNGTHTYTHSHTGGFDQNTARWCFGANDRIKNGERGQAHTWAGEQYQAILWGEAIDDKIGPLHAAKYADLISQGKHTATRLQDGPYDHLRGNAAYSCPTGTNRPLPLSIEAVTA